MTPTAAELDALQAEATTARERALDEVGRAVGALAGHARRKGIPGEVAISDALIVIDLLRTAPADPELARLEREVARTAVAAMREAADTDEWGVYSKSERIRLTSDSEKLARSAMFNHLIAKRKGGTK